LGLGRLNKFQIILTIHDFLYLCLALYICYISSAADYFKSVRMDQVYTEYREFLYRFFIKHVKIPALAEDFAQDVFIKFWQRKDHTNSVENIHAWLYTLARNHLTDHYRKLANEKKYQDMVWHEIEQHSNSIMQDIYEKELEEKISSILQALPIRQKEVYKLSRENGMSLEEIANSLDISRNTAKNHLVNALKVIRTGLRAIINISLLFWSVQMLDYL
jgi:RNA polymerase sigma-70 factor (family 1)